MSQHKSLIKKIAKVDIKDVLNGPPSTDVPRPTLPSPRPSPPSSSSSPTQGPGDFPSGVPPEGSYHGNFNISLHPYPPPHQAPLEPLYPQPYHQPTTYVRTPSQSPQLPNPAAVTRSPGEPSGSAETGLPPEPSRKQSKWTPAEDKIIVRLRGQGMKWGEISKQLPGRSDISCRLHYQNYIEKKTQWDEPQKDKLARVYERLKSDLWQPVASELEVPWRTVEHMHWVLGEKEMARRANVLPFSVSSTREGHDDPAGVAEGTGHVPQPHHPNHNTKTFDVHELTMLNTPLGSNGHNGPVSTFGNVRSPVVVAGGQSLPSDETDSDEETESQSRRPKRKARDEGISLPGFADLDSGVSAWAPKREEASTKGRKRSR